MTYPSDEIMECFHAMSQALGLTTDRGILEAMIPDRNAPNGCRAHEITGEAIDELVARGWVELIGEDEIECTDSGIYWLRRWCRKYEGAVSKARRML